MQSIYLVLIPVWNGLDKLKEYFRTLRQQPNSAVPEQNATVFMSTKVKVGFKPAVVSIESDVEQFKLPTRIKFDTLLTSLNVENKKCVALAFRGTFRYVNAIG